MATLISVNKGDGTCIGRCDAKCYNATEPHCDCICGGMNHGAGEKAATDNTRNYCEQWIERYKKDHDLSADCKGEVNPEIYQLKLF